MFKVIACLLLAAVAQATTYHVATTGNDSNDGLTTGTAWKTLQKGANTVNPDDVVQVAAGTYSGSVIFNRAGTLGHQIVFKPEPGVSYPILDGSSIPGGTYFIRFQGAGGSYITLQGFKIQSFSSTSVLGCVVIDGASQGVVIDGNKVTGCSKQGIITNTSGSTAHKLQVTNNEVYSNTGGGISLYIFSGGYAFIANNLVHDNVGTGNWDGIQAGSSDGTPSYVVIRNNVVYGNGVGTTGADQIDLGGHAFGDFYLAENNTISGPGGDFKCQQGFGGTTIICRHNLVQNTGMTNYEYPSPVKIYNNTIYNAGHAWQIYNSTVTPVPGLSFGTGGYSLWFINNALLANGNYIVFVNQSPYDTAWVDLRTSSVNMRHNAYWPTAAVGKGIAANPTTHATGFTHYNFSQHSTGAAQFANWQNASGAGASGYFDKQDVGSIWIDPNTALGSIVDGSFVPVGGSPLLNQADTFTTTTAGGVATVTVPVVDAHWFFDGWGWSVFGTADSVKVGSNSPVLISSINYTTNVITLTSPITFNSGDAVSLGETDIGYAQSGATTTTSSSSTVTTTSSTSTSTTTITIPAGAIRGFTCNCVIK